MKTGFDLPNHLLLKFKASLLMAVLLLGTGCVNVTKKITLYHNYDAVKTASVWTGPSSIRALVVNGQQIFFAGSDGVFGYLNTADHSLAYLGSITPDNEDQSLEFRSLTRTKKVDYLLSAGIPAALYKVNLFGKRKKLFEQNRPGTFYDAMKFWNDREGLAIGDPTSECMSFLITRDAGKTWQTVPCKKLPKAKSGEAAFAASNSNISIVGDSTWVVSGGKTSRVYFSADKGKNWTAYPTPLRQDKATTGGYSIDFYNNKIGFIIGGDYTKPQDTGRNKVLTTDGGKTWHLIADNDQPGYQSCVRFVPKGKGNELVSVGPTGLFYSKDQGKTWSKLSDEKFYTLRFLNDSVAYAAGKGKIKKLTFMSH